MTFTRIVTNVFAAIGLFVVGAVVTDALVTKYYSAPQSGYDREPSPSFAQREALHRKGYDGEVRIAAAQRRGNTFYIGGHVNYLPVEFMVDTGASLVLLNRTTAERAGIYDQFTIPQSISTANGTVMMWKGRISTLRVGDLVLHNVEAVVSSDRSVPNLLGMSFLSRIGKFESKGAQILLYQ